MSYSYNTHSGEVSENTVTTSNDAHRVSVDPHATVNETAQAHDGTEFVELENGTRTTKAAAEAAGLPYKSASAPLVETQRSPEETEGPDDETKQAIEAEKAKADAIKDHDLLLDQLDADPERKAATLEGIIAGDLDPSEIVKPEAVGMYVDRAAEMSGMDNPLAMANLLTEADRQAGVRATINGDASTLKSLATQAMANAEALATTPALAEAIEATGEARLVDGNVLFNDGESRSVIEMLLDGSLEFDR